MDDPRAAIAWLRSPDAVRARCAHLLALGEDGALAHFTVDPGRIGVAAEYVAETIRQNHPTLRIPHHARWRHFAAGGIDRWAALAEGLRGPDEAARVRFDLCTVSVLLDAGAGPGWRYAEPGTGQVLARSEGLAVASLGAFAGGLFAGEGSLRADADGLEAIDAAALGRAFQAGPGNRLVGLEGRAALLRRLAAALRARPDLFGAEARIGRLFDWLAARRGPGGLPARAILAALLDGLGPVWSSRIAIGGVGLGDVWHHPAAGGEGLTAGLVPFHKLSQWLAYSLIEVFEDRGIPVTGIDALTGLPEYRNGGLLLDLGVLALREPALMARPLPVGHEAVVEWRALTVALLDRLAGEVRTRLGRDAASLPLSRILEGGTWAAGRRIARARRADGAPPLQVESDGTVF